MVYFTADLHLGHENIIHHCSRPFRTVEEMDRALIDAWNKRVGPEDTVYILGDLMFSCKDPAGYLRQLAGKKHLILGNHDAVWMKRLKKQSRACRRPPLRASSRQRRSRWTTAG